MACVAMTLGNRRLQSGWNGRDMILCASVQVKCDAESLIQQCHAVHHEHFPNLPNTPRHMHVQCLARKIWRILLKSIRPTNMLQVTSLGSGVQNGFKRMNLKK
jgi:hypothetical protein